MFKRSVVCALNPVKDNPQRITEELRKQAEQYDWSGVPFTTPYGDNSVSRFEKKNNISINVYGFQLEHNQEWEGRELLIFPLRLSEMEGKEFKEVNLFYITKNRDEFEDKHAMGMGESEFETVSHYCVITSLSRLSSMVRKDNNGKAYICRKCCNSFTSQKDLDKHIPCMSTTFDRYPEPRTILRFKNFRNVAKVPLTFIFDFASFLEPIKEEEESNDIKIKHIQEHIPSAFALHCISRVPDYQPNPIVRIKTKPDENMVMEFLDTSLLGFIKFIKNLRILKL